MLHVYNVSSIKCKKLFTCMVKKTNIVKTMKFNSVLSRHPVQSLSVPTAQLCSGYDHATRGYFCHNSNHYVGLSHIQT